MADVVLDSPEYAVPPVTRIRMISLFIDATKVIAGLEWQADDGTVVYSDSVKIEDWEEQSGTVTIPHPDYTDLKEAVIQASHVGETFFSVVYKAVLNKAKEIREWQGTVT